MRTRIRQLFPRIRGFLLWVALLLCVGLFPQCIWGQANPDEHAFQLSCKSLDAEIAKKHEEAFRFATKALALIDSSRPTMLAADLHQRIGYNLFWLKDKERTLPHLEKSNEIISRLCPDCSEMRAKNLTYAGQFHYFVKRDVRKALHSLKAALETWMLRPVMDTVNFAMTLSTLGDTYRQLGEYESAEAVLTQAHLIRSEILGPYSKEALTSRLKLGAVYLEASQYQRAKDLYETVMVETKGKRLEKGIELHMKNNLAVALTELGEWERAEKLYLEIMQVHSNARTFDAEQLLATLQNLALLHIKTGNLHAAEQQFTKARFLTQRHFFSNFDLALLERDLSYFHQQRGDIRSALLHNQAAIHLFDTTVNPLDPLSLPRTEHAKSTLELLQPLKTKGELLVIAQEKGVGGNEYLTEALRSFDLAIALIDEIWAVSEAPEDKLYQNEYGVNIYDQAIAICDVLFRHTRDEQYLKRAFFYLEKGKAQLMLESLQEARAANLENIPENLQEQSKSLRGQITNLKIRIESNEGRTDSTALLQQKMLQLRHRQTWLQDSIRRGYPAFARLAHQRPILDLDDLLKHYTAGDELFVEYQLADSNLTVFSIHRGRAHLRRTRMSPEDQQSIHSFGRTTRETARAGADPVAFQALAASLFELLLGPETRDSGHGISKIRIIPDGIISTIPFEALIVDSIENPVDFSELDYAIRHFTIRHAPSGSLLHAFPSVSPARDPESCLGMAWSDKKPSSTRSMANKEWPDLPGTAMELNSISEKIQGRYFWGLEASERAFKENSADFGLIHLALHGSAKDNRPALIFPAGGLEEDGILYLEELYSLPLAAKLTVLSACETGLGAIQQGEGVMSMARGFGVAGCPTVVMSLWDIEDRASSLIMERFYEELSAGKGADEALRNAKLNFLKTQGDSSAPAFWASFVPFGQTGPVLKGGSGTVSQTLGIAAMVAILLAAGFVILFREKEKQT